MTELTREAVGALDSSGQLGDVLDVAEHLHDALWRVESAAIAPHDAPGGLIVAGMGGSAVGGDLAVAALGDRARRPIATVRGYALPPWTPADATVLCSSYSGNTEETLSAYEAAGALGARRIVATTGGALAEAARGDGVPVIPLPGGFQPRAAVGYALVIALEAARLCGAAPALRAEIEAAAAHVATLVAAWGPDAAEEGEARRVARALHERVPVIAGADLTAPVAYRWKTQINENAKAPAFASELPELDHNELCGWEGSPALGPFAAVLLDDPELHPRVRRRVALTAELIEPGARGGVLRLAGSGTTRLERLVALVLLGDLVSLYLAVLRGVDPGPVAVLDRLKAALRES